MVPHGLCPFQDHGLRPWPRSFSEHCQLNIFETPVTVTPQQETSKTLNLQKFLKKYLTFTFGERTLTFGERTFTFGERAFTFGDNRGFRGFWNFFFRCWGVLGLRGSGGPVGGFRKYLNCRPCAKKGFSVSGVPFLDLVSQTPRPRGRGRPLLAEY